MFDIGRWVSDTSRDVERQPASDGERYVVILRRHYDVPVEELWDALTSPDRLKEFFLPISGELRSGGTYQFEGNAGGEILECDPPHRVRVTWVYGDNPPQQVALSLSQANANSADLELAHAGPADVAEVADFALAVGPGWDPALVALGTYLQGNMPEKSWWMESPEGLELIEKSVRAWQKTLDDRQIANPSVTAKIADASVAFYTGAEPPAES
ncbi:SRPBCC domain-containing protein [Mycobacterium sp.]|uniref:SRPBCC domain-containing protein n=1 Tax=Mycobacterium sp. TaxID=1785 RepID=UPI002CD73EF6|nr:SRPBCC domain-containing protein [Mycobacterium sp.]HTY35344.1 SRPBCC domain-containing protein [Mycobacterium sp.]